MTEAESIGFKPEGFQFGLGRNAFTPLDDPYLSDDIGHVPQDLRVLGVGESSGTSLFNPATPGTPSGAKWIKKYPDSKILK